MNTNEPRGRILVVDPSPIMREVLQTRLEAENCTVATAATGSDGKALLRDAPPDIVIVDTGITDVLWVDVVTCCRKNTSFTAAIVTTVARDVVDAQTAMSAGAFAYICKPFDFTDFVGQLQKALDYVEFEREKAEQTEMLARQVAEKTEDLRTTLELVAHREQRVNAIFNSLHEGLVAMSIEGDIMVTNRAFETMTGISGAGLIGVNVRLRKQENPIFDGLSVIVNQGKNNDNNLEIVVPQTGKPPQTLRLTLSDLVEAETILGHIVVLNDITEEKKAEHLRKSFLSNVSHEMLTPLTSICSLNQALRATTLGDSQVQFVELMGHAANELVQLIDSILDASKIESHTLELVDEQFSIQDICEQAVQQKAKTATEKAVELMFVSSVEKSDLVWGDQKRLMQILDEILSNAIKFAPQGKVELRLQLLRSDRNKDQYLFQVFDTGIGVDNGNMTAIFKEFVQVDGGSTRKHGGVGLGLFIAKSLIEMMGGSIRVVSEPEHGTLFGFAIPFFKHVVKSADKQ